MRIMMPQVCQPDAESPPSMVSRAAFSSRCIGCGSNSAAKATISSRETGRGPYCANRPGLKSSKWIFDTGIFPDKAEACSPALRDPSIAAVHEGYAGPVRPAFSSLGERESQSIVVVWPQHVRP